MQNSLAILLPFLIGFIHTKIAKVKSDKEKFWISIIVSIVVGVILNLNQLQTINLTNAITFFVYVGLVVGTAQAVYLKYWKDNGTYVTLFGSSNTTPPENPIVNNTSGQN